MTGVSLGTVKSGSTAAGSPCETGCQTGWTCSVADRNPERRRTVWSPMPHVNELHEQHDPILVVSFASGDLSAADRDHATAQALVGVAPSAPPPRRRSRRCQRDEGPPAARSAHAISGSPTSRRRSFGPPACAGSFPLTAPGALFSRQLGVCPRRSASPGCCSAPADASGMGHPRRRRASRRAGPSRRHSTPAASAPAASAPAASIWPDQVFSSPGAAEAEASIQPHHDTSATAAIQRTLVVRSQHRRWRLPR